MEVEKKFLISDPTHLPLPENGTAVAQGYFDVPEGEMRVRQKGSKYFLTVKGAGTLSREEYETEIPEWVFRQLWPATTGRRIEKTRYAIPYEGLTIEIDVYSGSHQGLVVLEVEFPDEMAAEGFELPTWAASVGAVDVTKDPRYKNRALAS